MEELKVENIIIGKQFEESQNYQNFIEIVNKNKIKVYVVEARQKINIEKNLYFDVLWPDSNNPVPENALNNNSLVCKLNYNNFSMLFTGDIEKVAEEKMQKSVNNDLLKADILKVAHHGSKSSSTKEFLQYVNPKIAVIGVGKNNKFGHPDSDILNRLNKIRYKNL